MSLGILDIFDICYSRLSMSLHVSISPAFPSSETVYFGLPQACGLVFRTRQKLLPGASKPARPGVTADTPGYPRGWDIEIKRYLPSLNSISV